MTDEMKKIALWGYGAYGKRLHRLFDAYSTEACVVRVYDKNLHGTETGGTRVEDPEMAASDYRNGLFDAVMISVNLEKTYREILSSLESQNIPVYVPLEEEDLVPGEQFSQTEPDICFDQKGYRLHVFRDLRGISLLAKGPIMYLFDEKGRHLKDQWDAYSLKRLWTHWLDLPISPRSKKPETIRLSGSYCILEKLWSHNYSHFSFESMDCIQLLEESGFEGKYVVPETDTVLQLLDIYGIQKDRIMTSGDFEPAECYQFEKVYYPKLIRNDRRSSAPVLKRMAEKIQQSLVIDPSRYPECLYVRRIGSRKLLNGSAVSEKYGFTEMIPEEYPLLEQMNYFYNADVVLSPHGANSANSLYMRPGSVLIETFGRNWVKYSYVDVLREKKVYYLPVIEGPIMAEYVETSPDMNADYTIPGVNLDMAMSVAFGLLERKKR